MKIQVIFAVIFVALMAAESEAKSPFGRSRIVSRGTPQHVVRSQSIEHAQHSQLNEEELTRRYGPSILVQQPATEQASPRVVTQPNSLRDS
jgi:hypothetical protein